ncbi:MAG: DUF1127 domain-containing protein [Alphaproteobacteria bacterium MedPE-SWcel]|nr:MAG: DUF1127 domain-containing protein [Alphaproteobacteria bacterium MedPE-SWcel]
MAYTSNAQTHTALNPLALIAGFFRAIGRGMVKMAEANSRVIRARAMIDMSDEELAARGIKREDVVKHVFGDIMYL